MSDTVGISFRDLLAYNHSETERWHRFFVEHPQALALEVGGQMGTVAKLVEHTFQTELYFATRLSGQEIIEADFKPASDSIDDIFYLHEKAHSKLAQYLSKAAEADMSKKHHFDFDGGFDASERKMVMQFFWHGINHWAQVALIVRQAGMPVEKPRDIILSHAMQ